MPSSYVRIPKSVKERLTTYADIYEQSSFLDGDPSWFMHQVVGKRNQETMAFIASCLSYGSRKVFMPRIQYLLKCAKAEPYEWIRKGLFRQQIPDDFGCFYRLYTNHTMYEMFTALEVMFQTYGSLSAYIRSYVNENYAFQPSEAHKSKAKYAIEAVCTYFSERHICGIIPKNTTSSCKRVCMFLRWMVRDNSPVDLGIWGDFIDKRSLIIPLDTHVMQQAAVLGLLSSKTTSMRTAEKLTQQLAKVFPDDPIKGDFALFGYGINQ